jgi:formylglycine-generating enzyme required for sulfatase activity
MITARMPTIAGLLALLSLALCCADVALSEEQPVQAGQTFRDCSDCPEMVVVPAGSFLMGSSAADMHRDLDAIVPFGDVPSFAANYARRDMAFEHPQHSVSIDRSFALGKYRVTRGEFAAFVRETGYSIDDGCTLWVNHKFPLRPEAGWQNPGFEQTDRDPVVCVSWRDAKAYIAWLNSKVNGPSALASDGPYLLPSEAEWEYAARAGTRTARWWGDSIGSGNANCVGCGTSRDKMRTSPAGSFQANAFGLSDVLGNVWEWCEDCWNETYAGAPQDGSTWIAGDCNERVMRGGSWNNFPWYVRSGNRSRETITVRTNYLGFRVVKTLPRTRP